MKSCITFCCVGWFALLSTAQAESPQADRVQPVIAKGIEFLQADMAKWRSEQGCAACHHGPLYLWSLNLAKQRGYAVDEPALKEMTHWLLTDEDARLLPRPAETVASSSSQDRVMAAMMGRQGFLQPTIYLAHALHTLPADNALRQPAWRRVLDHFGKAQMADGSLVGTVGRPPVFNTPQILTRTALLGLAAAETRSSELSLTTADRQTLRRASEYVAAQPPDESHQGLVLRLWQAELDPQSTTEDSKLIATLRDQQQPDGGWRQSPELPSDAFATGQTLYVLHLAGVHADDAAVQRGIEFLTRMQAVDGTWPMISRPHPETGERSKNLNPITYAACAWGVLGLVSHVPAQLP